MQQRVKRRLVVAEADAHRVGDHRAEGYGHIGVLDPPAVGGGPSKVIGRVAVGIADPFQPRLRSRRHKLLEPNGSQAIALVRVGDPVGVHTDGNGAGVLLGSDRKLAVRPGIDIGPMGNVTLSGRVVTPDPNRHLIGVEVRIEITGHHAVARAVGRGESVGTLQRHQRPAVGIAAVAPNSRADKVVGDFIVDVQVGEAMQVEVVVATLDLDAGIVAAAKIHESVEIGRRIASRRGIATLGVVEDSRAGGRQRGIGVAAGVDIPQRPRGRIVVGVGGRVGMGSPRGDLVVVSEESGDCSTAADGADGRSVAAELGADRDVENPVVGKAQRGDFLGRVTPRNEVSNFAGVVEDRGVEDHHPTRTVGGPVDDAAPGIVAGSVGPIEDLTRGDRIGQIPCDAVGRIDAERSVVDQHRPTGCVDRPVRQVLDFHEPSIATFTNGRRDFGDRHSGGIQGNRIEPLAVVECRGHPGGQILGRRVPRIRWYVIGHRSIGADERLLLVIPRADLIPPVAGLRVPSGQPAIDGNRSGRRRVGLAREPHGLVGRARIATAVGQTTLGRQCVLGNLPQHMAHPSREPVLYVSPGLLVSPTAQYLVDQRVDGLRREDRAGQVQQFLIVE